MQTIILSGFLMFVFTCFSNAASSLIEDLGQHFNAVIGGDFYAQNGDTEGRHFSLGDFNLIGGSYSVGTSVVGQQNPVSPGQDDLIIVGDYHGGDISTVTHDAVIGGSLVSGTIGLGGTTSGVQTSGTLTTGVGSISISVSTGNVSMGAGTIASDQIFQRLANESMTLSTLEDTAGVSTSDDGFGNLGINVSGNGLQVLNVTESFWDGNKFRTITAGTNTTLIINVSGIDIGMSGTMTLAGGITQSNILINYYEAESWTMANMDHNGSVLAAGASGSQEGGGINGVAFIGGDFEKTGGGEFHNYLFTPDHSLIEVVPEPSSVSFLFVTLSFLLMRKKR